MSDYDDNDDYSSLSMIGGFSCTPLTIYLSVACVSMIVYYSNTVLKGKWPDGNTGSSLCFAMLCSAVVVFITCRTNFIMSFVLAILFSICAMCFAMGKFSIPKIY